MLSLRVEGGEELAAALNSLSGRVSRRILTESLVEAGEPMRKRIAQHAPREPGAPDLADNVNIAGLRKRAGEDERTASVGIGVPRGFYYDFFLEYGTVKMGAKPFYRPGFDTEVPAVLGRMGQALWRELAGKGIGRSVSSPSNPFSPTRGDLL